MLVPGCKELFPLGGSVYLDHGGYGVAPTEVLGASVKIKEEIESAPGAFFAFRCRDEWEATAATVAERFSVRKESLALIENVTDGINAVLRSLSFRPGDEILLTSSAYGAIRIAAERIARGHGARVTSAPLQFPNPDPEQCIAAIRASLTPKTCLAILDHVSSSTALVLPIAEMTRACRERGIPVLVDGAHAPGNVVVDLNAIDADWYVANLHKWYFVPRGCGFLWVASLPQENLMPNVLSWDIGRDFPNRFAWTGTRDPSSWLAIPAAFEFMDRFGESAVRGHNHALIREGAELLAEAWGVRASTPRDMIGSMVLAPLPDGLPFAATDEGRFKLQEALWNSFRIMTSPSFGEGGRIWIRISGQIYNEIGDYEKLAAAILRLKDRRGP